MKNRPGENLSQDISFQFPDSPRSSRRSSLPSLSRISTPTTKIKRCQRIHSIFIKRLVNLRQLRIHQNIYNSAVVIIIFDFQTFIVISKGKDIFRFSAEDSMWFLSPFSPVRRVAIHVLVHPLFSLIIIATILINCLMMILTPSERIESTE